MIPLTALTLPSTRIGTMAATLQLMGRTVPSFRIALSMEQDDWKPFRNALDKSDRKKFDEIWDIPRLYASACSDSLQLVALHPNNIMSILSHHYKELKKCMEDVKQIEGEIVFTTANKY